MKKLFAGALLSLGLAAGKGQADPVGLNQWYTFGFFGGGSALVAGGGSFTTGQQSLDAPNPAWTFTCATACTLTVTDGFSSGDEFDLSDFGSGIGSTNAVATGGG